MIERVTAKEPMKWLKKNSKSATPNIAKKFKIQISRQTNTRYPDLTCTYEQKCRTLREVHSTVLPPTPKTLLEFGNSLKDEQWINFLSFTGGKFSVRVVDSSTDGSTSLIFYDPDYIKKIFKYHSESEEFC
ncbi:hypothetical protein KQX54_001720 [Cotesia glomerata]|uniref:Uncharacterized protein n=1 Tax=Cotesia glomerata TaxID=32391 RepID=A0AAV7I0F8_COTGL|nr:hypothetical protein KQX54_001720 [Cotesia glomerata]